MVTGPVGPVEVFLLALSHFGFFLLAWGHIGPLLALAMPDALKAMEKKDKTKK